MSDLQIVNIATFIVDGYYRNFVFVKMEASSSKRTHCTQAAIHALRCCW